MSPTTAYSVLRSSGPSSFTTCKCNNETALCLLAGEGRGDVVLSNGRDRICAKNV